MKPIRPNEPGLRLLQVSAFFAPHGGGIEVVADQLARQLAAGGEVVRWLAGGSATELPRESVPRLSFEQARSWDPIERWVGLPCPLWSPGSISRLWQAIGWSEVVHIHDYLYMSSLLATLFAVLRRRPVLLTQHIGHIDFRSRTATALLRLLNRTLGVWALTNADQVVFVGRPVLDHFQKFVRFRTPPKLLPNGVDHEVFHAKGRSAPREDMTRVLFVGRFVEKKGVDLLRDCVDIPKTTWTFVGWGPRSPASWTGLPDNVHVAGRLLPTEVASQCRRADLLVLPSTGEGFPLVLQEALACGTPVMVSREVADAFPIADKRCVFDVELRVADPVRALRSALEALLSDTQRLHAASIAAAALSMQWSWDHCVASYRSMYLSIRRNRRTVTAHPQDRPVEDEGANKPGS